MNFDFERRLNYLQQRYGDRLITLLTVLLLILMFVIAPLQASESLVFQALAFVIGFAIICGALIISGSPTSFVMLIIAFSMNATASIMRLRQPSVLDIHLLAGAWTIIAITLGLVAARAVFAPGPVTYHRVIGAVLLYLLIGLAFVALFVFVSVLIPNAFSGIVLVDSPALASNLIYFSFVTLTSVGYGDILPVHPVARSLCNVEAIMGQLYPATLLARLVTLELEGRR